MRRFPIPYTMRSPHHGSRKKHTGISLPIASCLRRIVTIKKTHNPAALPVFSQKFSAPFIGFPCDEDACGGCLAAGRGFVHVSLSGDLEPCPTATFSDANLATVPPKEALRARLLFRIREERGLLTETFRWLTHLRFFCLLIGVCHQVTSEPDREEDKGIRNKALHAAGADADIQIRHQEHETGQR